MEYKHHVTGMSHHMDELMDLAAENADYSLPKKELVDIYSDGERIYKYAFSAGTVELVPEPDNPYDSNAIKVLVDGHHIGYIKKGSTAKVRKQMESGDIVSVSAQIGGGPYKQIAEDDDGEYSVERDESPYYVHIKIVTPEQGEMETQTEAPPIPHNLGYSAVSESVGAYATAGSFYQPERSSVVPTAAPAAQYMPKYSRGSYVAARILSLIAAWLIVAVAVLGAIGGGAIVAVIFAPFAVFFFILAKACKNNLDLIAAAKRGNTPAGADRRYIVSMDTCKVHRPDCLAIQRTSPEKRMVITTNLQKLGEAGYKPCKKCNPQ